MSVPRRTTAAARLARLGFADPARAELLLTGDLVLDVGQAEDGLVDALATAADPDLALAALARMPRDAELGELNATRNGRDSGNPTAAACLIRQAWTTARCDDRAARRP